MQTKEFSIKIKANASKVWFVLWDDFHYRKWTTAFCEGSYFKGELKEGSRIHFLTPTGDGMYSTISKLEPNKTMYFTHIGDVKQFEEQALDEKTKQWTGAKENYSLSENDGTTTLTATIDLTDEHVAFFDEAFPKGLAIVKELAENFSITVSVSVNASLETTWNRFTSSKDITKWNAASEDWHTPKAENNLTVGGEFVYRMEAKDGSMGFDLKGIYTTIELHKRVEYIMEDDRKVKITFENKDNETTIIEQFEAENIHSFELQRDGWQAILNNFKNYVEQTK